jgi:hypothetical protein
MIYFLLLRRFMSAWGQVGDVVEQAFESSLIIARRAPPTPPPPLSNSIFLSDVPFSCTSGAGTRFDICMLPSSALFCLQLPLFLFQKVFFCFIDHFCLLSWQFLCAVYTVLRPCFNIHPCLCERDSPACDCVLDWQVIQLWFVFSKPIPVAARSKAWVWGRSFAGIASSNPAEGMNVSFECCMLSGRGICDGLITRPEESYRMWFVFSVIVKSRQRRGPGRLGAVEPRDESRSYYGV